VTPSRRIRRSAGLGLALLTLAGCATTGQAPPPPPAEAYAPPASDPRAHVDHAVTLLCSGDAAGARMVLMDVLARRPGDRRARKLLVQIDRDPVALLGARYFTYKVRPGETLFQIARRYLGDSQLFYALARYNGLTAPDALEAGRTLKIPGEPKRAAAPQAPAASAPTPARPARDPVRAGALRAAALDQMSGGRIDQAVNLLRQAQQLDPGNALIRRDLERATRVQGAVRDAS
jgi:LysM repeat protein